MMMPRLAACLLNVSEARRMDVVSKIARSAVVFTDTNADEEHVVPKGCALLNVFADQHYNRAVFTLAGTIEELGEGVLSACRTAMDNIKLDEHEGSHPRLAVVDLIPLHPLNNLTAMDECVRLGEKLANDNLFFDKCFLFGHSDLPQKRTLPQRRKELGWFHNEGTALNRTVIGAGPYMSTFNVTLNTDDSKLAKAIARRIRESDDTFGVMGVHSLALARENNAFEIACNVNMVEIGSEASHVLDVRNVRSMEHVFGDFFIAKFDAIHQRIVEIAKHILGSEYKEGLVSAESVIVGLGPKEAEKRVIEALCSGNLLCTTDSKHM